MATSGTQIITNRARLFLSDVSANNYRWSDSQLLVFLNDGQQIITEARPDSKLASDGSLLTVTDLAGIGSNISIADKWRVPLAHFVTARAFEMPGQERLNLDAANHHDKMFWNYVKTM